MTRTNNMNNEKYILDEDGNVVSEPDLLKWARWFETSKDQRIVARTDLKDVHVSTVFLGLDYNFGFGGKPLLWETLVFENKLSTEEIMGHAFTFHKTVDTYGERYHTKDEAITGHMLIVAKLTNNND